MSTAVLLDHVSAYAAAVRSHLAYLSPEQVEDLTYVLEADLAEALEDPRGAVVTGEIPIARKLGPTADLNVDACSSPISVWSRKIRMIVTVHAARIGASSAR